jgi:hypothetical protein
MTAATAYPHRRARTVWDGAEPWPIDWTHGETCAEFAPTRLGETGQRLMRDITLYLQCVAIIREEAS